MSTHFDYLAFLMSFHLKYVFKNTFNYFFILIFQKRPNEMTTKLFIIKSHKLFIAFRRSCYITESI